MNSLRVIIGIAFIGAVVALSGCASEPSAYKTAVAEITARYRAALARVSREAELERQAAAVEAKRRRTDDQMISKVREPLGKFLAEAPPSCGSQHLFEATQASSFLMTQVRGNGGEIDTAFKRRLAATMLDIGDAAQKAGCLAAARQIYDDALGTLVDPRSADLRLRAQFAIAYMTRNAAKWTPSPTQAASAK
jgi:hypothetical protein